MLTFRRHQPGGYLVRIRNFARILAWHTRCTLHLHEQACLGGGCAVTCCLLIAREKPGAHALTTGSLRPQRLDFRKLRNKRLCMEETNCRTGCATARVPRRNKAAEIILDPKHSAKLVPFWPSIELISGDILAVPHAVDYRIRPARTQRLVGRVV